VTGGAGRLGLKTSAALLRDGCRVRVLDLDTPRNRRRLRDLAGNLEVCWGDVTSAESLRQALEGANAVVHMAGVLPPLTDRNPELARRVNVGGTRVLVELLREKGGRLPLVYTSSIVVFGATPEAAAPLDPEIDPPNPEEPYAETKWESEKLIREAGVDHVILRLPAAFDLDCSALRLIYRVPLANRFEFCHPDDTVLAVANAVKDFDAVEGNTLVICGGPSQRMTYGEMLGGALAVLGLPLPPERRFSSKWYCTDWYDTRKSQALLRYQRKSFDDYCRELDRTVLGPLSFVLVPIMRRLLGPVLGRLIVRLL
jgi:UDP-glucose 4-epimerase